MEVGTDKLDLAFLVVPGVLGFQENAKRQERWGDYERSWATNVSNVYIDKSFFFKVLEGF